MTREDAKQNIIKIRDGLIGWTGLNDDGIETFRLVIAALEQPEITHCKDCKHLITHGAFEIELKPEQYWCDGEHYPEEKSIPDGWYCAGAERRKNGCD